jgi:cytoskeletal protein RodZ
MKRLAITVSMALVALSAGAQSLSGIKVEPAQAQVGQPVQITGTFDSAGNPNCNLRVEYGDGTQKNFRINQEKDVPLVTSHTYTRPGSYKVSILPRTDLPAIKCQGADQHATVKVAAPPPVVTKAPDATAAAAGTAATGPACPAGWRLNAKSVNKKTGAFTCTAKRGTALPADRVACPGTLSYFENKSRGQLGCRP